MEFLSSLWLPVLLSAVFVFVASSLLHMVLPIHKGDYARLPAEADVLAALRGAGVAPGDSMFPCPSSVKAMGSPEMLERYRRGPVGFMTVLPSGPPAMGRSLLQWFLFSLLVSVLVAYVGSLALPPGAAYLAVMRITATVAILTYGVSHVPDSIWKGHGWASTFKFLFDGVVYGLVTGGTFGWLWPDAG